MPLLPSNVINDRIYVLRTRWERYVTDGSFELFIEFTVAVNSLAEHFNRMRLPGLVRICEGLENSALSRLGTTESHPIAVHSIAELQRQMDALLGAVASLRLPVAERRVEEKPSAETPDVDWIKPRSVWLVVAPEMREMAKALKQQIRFFGFQMQEMLWGGALPEGDMPLAVLFMPSPGNVTSHEEHAYIATVRERCAGSQLIYLGAHPAIDTIVALMRSGIDLTIPQEEGSSLVLNCVLDLVQNYEP